MEKLYVKVEPHRLSTCELWSGSQAKSAHLQDDHVKTTVEQLKAFLLEPAVIKKYNLLQNKKFSG